MSCVFLSFLRLLCVCNVLRLTHCAFSVMLSDSVINRQHSIHWCIVYGSRLNDDTDTYNSHTHYHSGNISSNSVNGDIAFLWKWSNFDHS